MATANNKDNTAAAPPSSTQETVVTGAQSDPETLQTPEESRNASITAKTVWPTSSFKVESVPEITAFGTRLTQPQLKTALAAAKASGVNIAHDGPQDADAEDNKGGSN